MCLSLLGIAANTAAGGVKLTSALYKNIFMYLYIMYGSTVLSHHHVISIYIQYSKFILYTVVHHI